MAKTEAQKRAAKKYEARAARQINLKFYPPEYDLFDWVKSKPNGIGYIKDLIRQDMAAGK